MESIRININKQQGRDDLMHVITYPATSSYDFHLRSCRDDMRNISTDRAYNIRIYPDGKNIQASLIKAAEDGFIEYAILINNSHVTIEGKKLVLENTYQYGPMCVDRSIRGTGAFEALFFASLDQFRDRFPIMLTFVNQINKRSENAHSNKAHMETVGTFDFGDNHYYLMGIRTDASDRYAKHIRVFTS